MLGSYWVLIGVINDYMLRRLAQQRMILSDYECLKLTSSASSAISAAVDLGDYLLCFVSFTHKVEDWFKGVVEAVNEHISPSLLKIRLPGKTCVITSIFIILPYYIYTREGGNYSDVLPLKAARRDSNYNLTSCETSNLSWRLI